ncbi:uncharacterized protein DS421_1g10850 [Arachis hypogaea]|nr:uncharacterized protein DS421_1g10850 [Arachis hypogaea]
MKVNSDPFQITWNFAETEELIFSINMASVEPIGKDDQFELDMFEAKRPLYPMTGEDLLDLLLRKKEEEENIAICPQCSAFFDTSAAKAFDSYKKSKKGVH